MPTNWQAQLLAIVQSTSLIPTFNEWLEATGYREYERSALSGNINLQATAIVALYDYYQIEMQRRFGRRDAA
jgi:hypothetical protein